MKFIPSAVVCLLMVGFTVFSHAQTAKKAIAQEVENYLKAGARFTDYDLMTSKRSTKKIKDLQKGTRLTLNVDVLQKLIRNQEETITLNVPNDHGSAFELQLFKAPIFAADFSVRNSLSDERDVAEIGAHYRGIIAGDAQSLVSFSVFDKEIMGAIMTKEDHYTIAQLRNSKDHILYEQSDLQFTPILSCDTEDTLEPYAAEKLSYASTNRVNKCVEIYIEVDNSVYLHKGTDTGAYVTGLFNESATLFANDGINIALSEMLIWTSADPYTGSTIAAYLSQFQANVDNFNGDLAHLVAYGGGGGKAAGFSGFCNGDLDESMCYSGIHAYYNEVPVYSWSAMVFTHEMAHLMGSRHTHACVWNGDGTAIDGCANNVEGTCAKPPIPAGGGTIMSYCHLTNVGINFNLGFGPQPTSVILNNIDNAACLNYCPPVCQANLNISSAANKKTAQNHTPNNRLTNNRNYPNPFSTNTTIEYTLKDTEYVNIAIFDLRDKQVAEITKQTLQEAGTYRVDFESNNLANGTYFYRIQAGEDMVTNKMMIVR